MASPSVSILIPAFRARWLDLAIASALAQTHTDFELLISDDAANDSVQSVVAKWRDSRLRYNKNPTPRRPGTNRDHLIGLAQGEYLKFLFDDDFLLPSSVATLLEAARATRCGIAFHRRYVVDESGVVLDTPAAPLEGTTILTPKIFFADSIGAGFNFIGEPSNILIHAATLRGIDSPFGIAGRRMRFLTDMALYTNFVGKGYGMVGVSDLCSAFRRHGGQTSGRRRYNYSAGWYEWEVLRRWAVDAGFLSPEQYAAGTRRQLKAYKSEVRRYPELAPFIALGGEAEGEQYYSPRFREIVARADQAIDARRARSLDPPAVRSPVVSWLGAKLRPRHS